MASIADWLASKLEKLAPLGSNDLLLLRDADTGTIKKIKVATLFSGEGATLVCEDVVVADVPQTSVELSAFPVGAVALSINGLEQAQTAFSVEGRVVTLPSDLDLVAHDKLGFHYITV